MFSDGDNQKKYEEESFIDIRMGQIPMLSFEYLIENDPELSDKENFKRRKKAGDITVLGGRLFGKTFCVEKLDFNQYAFCAENETAGFASFDALHLKGVLNEMYEVWHNHPIMSLLRQRIVRNPFIFTTKNGISIEGINMKITAGSQAGDQFFQKHFKRLWIEEKSKETDTVNKKKTDSTSEIGCIFREAGMTDFTRHSPAGEIFYDEDLAYRILNLPQYINPNFDKEEYKKRVSKYGGKHTLGFRIYVEGEVVEEGETVFDMDTIRDLCYPHDRKGRLDVNRTIKHIEIAKKNFSTFKSRLITIRPSNAKSIYMCADIGQQGGITKIIIVADTGSKFNGLYKITLYNLKKPQQYDVLKYLHERLSCQYIALDSTGGMGEAIYSDMQVDKHFKNATLLWVAFNEDVPVGEERNEKGDVIKRKGKIVDKKMKTVDWSIVRLCHLFYQSLVFLPYDTEFDEQFDRVIAIISEKTQNVLYKCIASEDHLYQAWQVFAIAQWLVEYGKINRKRNNLNTKHCKSGV
jgi:hypothetical protein